MIFQANRIYMASLDVRDYQGLETLLCQAPPDGALWILIAPRRARKTWTLRAVTEKLTETRASYIDLRGKSLPRKPPTKGHCFLLDEPLALLQSKGDATKFVNNCASLYDQGAFLAVAVTPAEFEMLFQHGQRGGVVSEKSIHRIPPLSISEAAKLASRRTEAVALLEQLPSRWTRNAFLLELLFELQERHADLDAPRLLRTLLLETERTGIEYFRQVFEDGLTSAQRQIIRRIAYGENCQSGDCRALLEANLLETGADGRYYVADPVISVHISSLRIHHVSDVHVGPKSAQTVDAKVSGNLAVAADHGVVRQSYIQHIASLRRNGTAPHIVVISGDLTEWATVEQLSEAKTWVAGVTTHLAEHHQLGNDEPRVLLVGGNHDVDWEQTRGAGPLARHQPFADAFPDACRPKLETRPEERTVATWHYEGFGVEFLLLGSAEFGGDVDEDLEKGRLLRELAALREPVRPEEKARAEKVALDAARDDPGLVNRHDLEHANAHPWRAPVRIAVLHHPVSPLPTSTEIARYSGLLNAGAVKDLLLLRRFCLVLHGHAHSGWFSIERWPGRHGERKLHIAAAPSLGSREVQENLGYNEILIHRDRDAHGRPCFSIRVRRYLRSGQHNWELAAEIPAFVPEADG